MSFLHTSGGHWNPLRATLFCGFFYSVLFFINHWLTLPLEKAPGVSWIYLPAGLRLFLVLIFGLPGVIGIVAASMLITSYRDFDVDLFTIIGIGLISGFAPYLARYMVMSKLKIAADLGNLSIQSITLCILVFAALSSSMHQLWFTFRGFESGSLMNTFVMFIGDVLGSLLLISLIKIGIDIYKNFSKK